MMTTRPLVIFGSAEIARLAKFYFENDSDRRISAFTVDDEFVDAKEIDGRPLIPFSQVTTDRPPTDYDMFVALSYAQLNQRRQQKYAQAKAAGYTLANYVCSKSVTWPDLTIGDNCFILENQTIQPGVTIGDNVMLWSGNHIGHGSTIAAHTYFASHVVVSGHCTIGERCFFGVNATIKDFTKIGDDCFVAMDASVSRDMNAGSVALGTPATIFEADDRRARVLKRQYFRL
jgi:sugar O-acyltransferase (sialic acid O-acetyltransferase NeuD family)